MSSLVIKGNASGTGSVSLKPRDSHLNTSVTIPDEDGIILTDVSDISENVKNTMNVGGTTQPLYIPRAWVNYNHISATIRDSGNVSSVTDDGAGYCTVNFAVAMQDVNYSSVVTGTGHDTNGGYAQADSSLYGGNGTYTGSTTAIATRGINSAGTAIDHRWLCVIVIR